MTTPLLEQWEAARSRPALFLVCCVFGGLPPGFAYLIAHHVCVNAAGEAVWHPAALALPFCLAYSVRTVWTWGESAFRDRLKTVCAIGSFELVMILMPPGLRWASLIALAGLVLVNAVATACNLLAELPAAPVAKRQADPVPKVPARVLEPSRAVATRRREVPT